MKASLPFKYITAVKNEKHQVVFDFKDDNGKRKRKWVSTGLSVKCSKKELKVKVDEIVGEFYEDYCSGKATRVKSDKIEKGSISEDVLKSSDTKKNGKYEFTAFMKYWLDTVKPTLAYTTHKAYCNCVRKITTYFDDKFPNILLGEVTGLMIQQFYNDMYNGGISGNTVKHYHANIHKALKYAVKMDLIPSNPSEKTELPKMNKYVASFYNEKELEMLFKAFKDDRMELVVYIAAYYGLRRSEVCGLKWDAIDFDKKTITIRRKIISDFGTGTGKETLICEDELKTEASKRTLPLIPKIEKMLKERKFLETHYSHLLKEGFDRTFDGFVCRDNFGKLITPNFISEHFKLIIRKNNLRNLRFHDLRHSCASLLVANGIPMKAIQEWLGHSTFNVTANYYSHLDYNSKISSAETIAKLLGGDDADKSTNEIGESNTNISGNNP